MTYGTVIEDRVILHAHIKINRSRCFLFSVVYIKLQNQTDERNAILLYIIYQPVKDFYGTVLYNVEISKLE